MYWPENQFQSPILMLLDSALFFWTLQGVGKMVIKCFTLGDFTGGQWLRHQTSTAGGVGSIPGLGTRSCMPHVQPKYF